MSGLITDPMASAGFSIKIKMMATHSEELGHSLMESFMGDRFLLFGKMGIDSHILMSGMARLTGY